MKEGVNRDRNPNAIVKGLKGMKKHRDPNRFVVMKKRCDQCPFSKNQTTISAERKAQIVAELYHTNQPFICHKAIRENLDLVCSGFYDTEPNLVVRLAQMLGIVEFDELPAHELVGDQL